MRFFNIFKREKKKKETDNYVMDAKDIKFALYNFLKKNPDKFYTIEEMSLKFGIPKSTILGCMVALVNTGVVKKEKDSKRNIFKYSFNF